MHPMNIIATLFFSFTRTYPFSVTSFLIPLAYNRPLSQWKILVLNPPIVKIRHPNKLTPFLSSSSDDTPTNNTSIITGITLKMAFDKNYAVDDLSETKSERFTSPSSLDLVHRLRRISDCVLVGRGTVERDDCTLTVRRVPLLNERDSQPVRVAIDPKLRLLKARKFRLLEDGLPTIVYHSSDTSSLLETVSSSVTLVRIDSGSSHTNTISPSQIVQDLASKHIHHVMIEGGPMTALSFLEERLVDRAILIRAPMTFQKPVGSDLTDDVLQRAGLQKLGEVESDGDVVECWSRVGVPWPDEDLGSWP